MIVIYNPPLAMSSLTLVVVVLAIITQVLAGVGKFTVFGELSD